MTFRRTLDQNTSIIVIVPVGHLHYTYKSNVCARIEQKNG